MAGDCGRGGASTTTWRDSSSRVNSIGRKITARAISTNAPTMRCFSPLSSKAMIYSPYPFYGPAIQAFGHAIERSEQQNDIIRGSLGALRVQGGGDIRMTARRNLAQDQRRLQLRGRPRTRGRQRCNGPILHQAGQGFQYAIQVFVRQQAEDRQVASSWRCGTQALRQVLGGLGIVPDVQQELAWLAVPGQVAAIEATGHPGPPQRLGQALRLQGNSSNA